MDVVEVVVVVDVVVEVDDVVFGVSDVIEDEDFVDVVEGFEVELFVLFSKRKCCP